MKTFLFGLHYASPSILCTLNNPMLSLCGALSRSLQRANYGVQRRRPDNFPNCRFIHREQSNRGGKRNPRALQALDARE
ncbi:unnamed protein product [Periconia digitata]|uniref:Uncharacterized protein n=1 Tax=Periconia digitata TaxID=1303443 RepID=A0A9W4USV1_9PLEO|nr:unnamed protein product [Periconia digitata]